VWEERVGERRGRPSLNDDRNLLSPALSSYTKRRKRG